MQRVTMSLEEALTEAFDALIREEREALPRLKPLHVLQPVAQA